MLLYTNSLRTLLNQKSWSHTPSSTSSTLPKPFLAISINDSTSTAGAPVMGIDMGKVFVDKSHMLTPPSPTSNDDDNKENDASSDISWLNKSPAFPAEPTKVRASKRREEPVDYCV